MRYHQNIYRVMLFVVYQIGQPKLFKIDLFQLQATKILHAPQATYYLLVYKL